MSLSFIGAELRSVKSLQDAADFQEWLRRKRLALAGDCETNSLEWWLPKFRLRTVQFGDTETGWVLRWDRWGYLIEQALRLYDRRWVWHNGPGFDRHALEVNGLSFPWNLDDTLQMAKIVDSSRKSFALKDLVEDILGPEAVAPAKRLTQAIEELGLASKGDVLAKMDPDSDAYIEYAGGDVVILARLYEYYVKMVEDYRGVYEVFMGSWHVVSDMEHQGVYTDQAWATQQAEELTEKVRLLRGLIEDHGITKPRSTKQKIDKLLSEGWEPTDFTAKTGAPKLDKKTLEGLDYDVIPLLMEYNKYDHWLSAYVNRVLEAHNGIVYPKINNFGAVTGRESYSGPPLQQIPSRDTEAWAMRKMFLPRPGEVLYGVDYASQELRIAAHFSGDELLVKMLDEGADMHTYNASQIWQIKEDEVTKEQRALAKILGLGRQYGSGIKKTAKVAGVSMDEARGILERLDGAFERTRTWKKEVENEGKRLWYSEGKPWTTTILGRRVYLPVGLYEPKFFIMVNHKIQGSGKDVLSIAHCRLAAAGLAQYVYLDMHDEVVYSVPPGPEGLEIAMACKKAMNVDDLFNVKLPTELSDASDWWVK